VKGRVVRCTRLINAITLNQVQVGVIPFSHVALKHIVVLRAAEYSPAHSSETRHCDDFSRCLRASTNGFWN
jgi:hypothetical protein